MRNVRCAGCLTFLRAAPSRSRRRNPRTTTSENPVRRTAMQARLNLMENPVITRVSKHLASAARPIAESGLPAATQELVKLRASQINGCAMCTDMHSKDALQAGETQLRLNLVAVWREAT